MFIYIYIYVIHLKTYTISYNIERIQYITNVSDILEVLCVIIKISEILEMNFSKVMETKHMGEVEDKKQHRKFFLHKQTRIQAAKD